MKKKATTDRKPRGFGEFDRLMKGLVKVPKSAVDGDSPKKKPAKKK